MTNRPGRTLAAMLSSAAASPTFMDGQAAVTPAELGWKYIHWGLGLFITGFLTGFIPIPHYISAPWPETWVRSF